MEALAVRGVIDAEASGDSTQLHPKEEMTRGQYMQWLMTALGLNASSGNAFSDVNENAPYYEAVTAARSLGITSGPVTGALARVHDHSSGDDDVDSEGTCGGWTG